MFFRLSFVRSSRLSLSAMYPTPSLVTPAFKRFPILFQTGSKKWGFLAVSQEAPSPCFFALPLPRPINTYHPIYQQRTALPAPLRLRLPLPHYHIPTPLPPQTSTYPLLHQLRFFSSTTINYHHHFNLNLPLLFSLLSFFCYLFIYSSSKFLWFIKVFSCVEGDPPYRF